MILWSSGNYEKNSFYSGLLIKFHGYGSVVLLFCIICMAIAAPGPIKFLPHPLCVPRQIALVLLPCSPFSPNIYSPAALSPLIIGPVILEPLVKDLVTYKTVTSMAIYFAAHNDTSIRLDPVVYLAIIHLARPRFALIMY